jgi:hypothetical protein
MNKKDFPAAHSMDTTWFAVDEKGHVGEFSTGEAGCLPESCGYDEEGLESFVTLLDGIDPERIEFYADDLCTREDGQVFKYSWRSMKLEPVKLRAVTHVYSVVLWLKDDSLLNHENKLPEVLFGSRPESYSKIIRLPNRKFLLGYATGVSKAGLESAIKNNLVNRIWIGLTISPERLGFYSFDHGGGFENWIAGPFVKDGIPVNPVNFDQLPDSIKTVVGKLRLQGVDFAVDHSVDAYAHDRCNSWGSRFVSLTGVVHEEETNENG